MNLYEQSGISMNVDTIIDIAAGLFVGAFSGALTILGAIVTFVALQSIFKNFTGGFASRATKFIFCLIFGVLFLGIGGIFGPMFLGLFFLYWIATAPIPSSISISFYIGYFGYVLFGTGSILFHRND